MIINHNMNAMNAHRQMSANTVNSGKSMEKLSSGLRINRAGDDAAGLAISEKMRGQIRGLDQASRNSQDAISMIQTAEGGLNETHSILQRMRELAVQSASDTNVGTDRKQIQGEMDQLAKEITRISNDTEFNQQNLIGGNLNNTFQVGANKDQNINLSIKAMDAKSLGVAGTDFGADISGSTKVSTATVDKNNKGTALTDGASLTLSADATAAKTAWAADAAGLTGVTITSAGNSSTYNDYKIVTVEGGTADVKARIDNDAKTITLTGVKDKGNWTANKINAAFADKNIGLKATGDASVDLTATAGVAATTKGLADDEVKLTIGAENVIVKNTATSATFTSDANKGLTVNFDGTKLDATTAATIAISKKDSTAMSADGNTKAVAAAGIDVTTQATANSAIETINDAIETVSTERSKLGAYQNRLEHTIANLNTSSENLQASESRIRDVDMAKEMMSFSKNNILSQAAQAMLAQANQQPQGVLQLLR